MSAIKTVLVVEDNEVNRRVLCKILREDYVVLEAKNGKDGLEQLSLHAQDVAAVILDLVMPVMDGFSFLRAVYTGKEYQNLPIIVSTGNDDAEHEKLALHLGAWDFVSKPYNPEILKFRLRHAIEHSQMSAFEKLKDLAENDTLTGISNKSKFFTDTEKMLRTYPQEKFVLVRFDINHFQLVNSFYGMSEGNRFLCSLAALLQQKMKGYRICTYGRMEADVFAFCCPYTSEENLMRVLEDSAEEIREFKKEFDIVPAFGIYCLDDYSLPAQTMLDRATLAAKTCKGSYLTNVAFYHPEMSQCLEQEQEIVNEMQSALSERQFCVYLQPKYSLPDKKPCGAEALVRWNHPVKGLISPGNFVPVFEKNGFIAKVDYFVWEEVCALEAKWISEGTVPMPISVNMSRVNLYNPEIVEIVTALLDRYQIPHSLMELELTESAYMNDPQTMKTVMREFKKNGFQIHMDDFGSGYSSLSVLKDIEVDVLKIDMRFLEKSEIAGRGENIIASIVRMAKWLGIPTVAEGAESAQQVEFLQSIGCDCVQGFFFGRPMPVAQYEELIRKTTVAAEKPEVRVDLDALWASDPQMEVLFSDSVQASCVFEYEEGRLSILRANRAFHELFSQNAATLYANPLECVMPEYRAEVLAAVHGSVASCGFAECSYRKNDTKSSSQWINLKLKYVSKVGNASILFGSLFDITAQKTIETELKKLKNAVRNGTSVTEKLLIVDDQPVNRAVLRKLFDQEFTVLEAENGEDAIRVLEKNNYLVDLILLDLVMPVMGGMAFLDYKKTHEKIADIPVIMITAEDEPQQQVNTFLLGANDFIMKPFTPEVVRSRVQRALEATRRLKEIVWEYENTAGQLQYDPLTRLYNRQAAECLISSRLSVQTGQMNALVILDLDDFKQINHKYGHDFGDMALQRIGTMLRQFFRRKDVVARLGGDEFCIFLVNIPSRIFAVKKCQELVQKFGAMLFEKENLQITCSAGISVTTASSDFETLYREADNGLSRAKETGKRKVCLFGSDDAVSTMPTADQLISKEWLIDTLDSALMIVSWEEHEILYMSTPAMRLYGIPEYSGKKCYELLHGRSSPCPFCKREQLRYDQFYEWNYEYETDRKSLLLKDKLIDFYGNKVQLQIIQERTPV